MIKNKYYSLIIASLSHKKCKYLLAGAWNTIFGYLSGVTIYYLFGEKLGVLIVATIANILSISMSFLTYKLFVFKTRGNWLIAYMRAYVVYGVSAIIGILLLLFFVKWLAIEFWLAQGLVILLTVVVSYIGHQNFTFRSKGKN